MDWRLGWCEECGGLAAVERFSEGEMPAAIHDAGQELPILPTRLPCCLTCGSKRVTAPLVTYRQKDGKTTRTPAVFSAPTQEEEANRKKPKPTGFIHPGCGGELWMKLDGLHFALRPSIRSYTPNGEFIERVFTDR